MIGDWERSQIKKHFVKIAKKIGKKEIARLNESDFMHSS